MKLIKVQVLQCGCHINWFNGEEGHGMWTNLNQIEFCDQHRKDFRAETKKTSL